MSEEPHAIDNNGLDQAAAQAAHHLFEGIMPSTEEDRALAFVEQNHAIHRLEARSEQLEHEATHDKLTGLPNRRWLLDRLPTLVERKPGNFAMLFLDLDGLKQLNDSQGHGAGDHYIKLAAEVTQDAIRHADQSTDIPERRHLNAHKMHDLMARVTTRFAGDEFVVILGDVNSEEQLNAVMDRLKAAWAAKGIRASMGGEIHKAGDSWQEFLNTVDKLMYEQKKAGKWTRVHELDGQSII